MKLWIYIFSPFFYFSLSRKQIRQEKPYYIADPEVDSLVSFTFIF